VTLLLGQHEGQPVTMTGFQAVLVCGDQAREMGVVLVEELLLARQPIIILGTHRWIGLRRAHGRTAFPVPVAGTDVPLSHEDGAAVVEALSLGSGAVAIDVIRPSRRPRFLADLVQALPAGTILIDDLDGVVPENRNHALHRQPIVRIRTTPTAAEISAATVIIRCGQLPEALRSCWSLPAQGSQIIAHGVVPFSPRPPLTSVCIGGDPPPLSAVSLRFIEQALRRARRRQAINIAKRVSALHAQQRPISQIANLVNRSRSTVCRILRGQGTIPRRRTSRLAQEQDAVRQALMVCTSALQVAKQLNRSHVTVAACLAQLEPDLVARWQERNRTYHQAEHARRLRGAALVRRLLSERGLTVARAAALIGEPESTVRVALDRGTVGFDRIAALIARHVAIAPGELAAEPGSLPLF
jgi:hypothetical protein